MAHRRCTEAYGRFSAGSGGLIFAAIAVIAAGCTNQTRIEGIGQFGKPIAIASDHEAPLPRLARSHAVEVCPGPEGGCDSFCAEAPGDCPPGSCTGLLIDSGSPFTVLPDVEYSLGRECTEVRSAAGLGDDAPSEDALADAITRFRFDEVPVIRAPESGAGGWEWTAGDDQSSMHVGGVLGGNLLREFAIELRHQSGFDPSVAFYVHYPGSESVLADQGRAHIGLQFPGQLSGRILYDRCEIGPGIDCELEGIDIDPSDEVLIYESTRMVVDGCIAPPSCGVVWSPEVSEEPVEPGEETYECRLSPGGSLIAEECDQEDSGVSTSLLVSTGIPGLVLFADSAERILGNLDALPGCAELPAAPDEAIAVDACFEANEASLNIPGWPPLGGLQRLRLRSLGLVSGLSHVTGDPPCTRIQERLEGLVDQCSGFAERGRPWRPQSSETSSLGNSAVYLGEVHWTEEQQAPEIDDWINLLIVPETAAPAMALRREVGSKSVEIDGLLGSVLLEETEVVLDYTEVDDTPGLRVTCLEPGGGNCVSIPSCSVESEAEGAGEFGRVSCCYGLPPKLIVEEVLTGIDKDAPRIEDTCCPALPFPVREDLFAQGLCTAQYLP